MFLLILNNTAPLLNPIVSALQIVIDVLAGVGALLVVIQIIKCGITISKAEDAETASKAKKHLMYAIIGLVLIIAATTIVNVMVPFVNDWLSTVS